MCFMGQTRIASLEPLQGRLLPLEAGFKIQAVRLVRFNSAPEAIGFSLGDLKLASFGTQTIVEYFNVDLKNFYFACIQDKSLKERRSMTLVL